MIVLARIRSAFLLVIVGGTFLVGQSFSVADVLSAPFPSNLVSTTDGEMLAWIFNQEGKRNIWIAEGTDFKVRRLTNYLDDDGQIVEPIYYVPIIPMVLVNGAKGIGTGFSSVIPSFNHKDIIRSMMNFIDTGEDYEGGLSEKLLSRVIKNRRKDI